MAGDFIFVSHCANLIALRRGRATSASVAASNLTFIDTSLCWFEQHLRCGCQKCFLGLRERQLLPRLQRFPDAARRQGHIEMAQAIRRQRIDHRIHHGRGRADGGGFANAFRP